MHIENDVFSMDKMLFTMARFNINGMRIVTSPLVEPVAKISISPDFKWCSDEFRQEFNRWLRDEFGTEECAYIVAGNTVVVSPGMLVKLTNFT